MDWPSGPPAGSPSSLAPTQQLPPVGAQLGVSWKARLDGSCRQEPHSCPAFTGSFLIAQPVKQAISSSSLHANPSTSHPALHVTFSRQHPAAPWPLLARYQPHRCRPPQTGRLYHRGSWSLWLPLPPVSQCRHF